MNVDPVIFRQYDIRGTVGVDLTPDVARLVGRAVAAEAAERLERGGGAAPRRSPSDATTAPAVRASAPR